MTPESGIELKIVKTKENKLLGRTEVLAEIYHEGKGTPPRHVIRKKIAELLGRPVNAVYVRRLLTEYGIGKTVGEIHVYEDPAIGEEVEPRHIRIRNLNPEERKKLLEARRGGS
ncbi:MAG: 30S ribosomal protein S24e [Thermoprotei archaeon]|nr:30S ribosomal protein S24e [Thermoprotei archaeon]